MIFLRKVGKIFLCTLAIPALIAVWWIFESQPLRMGQVLRLLDRYTLTQQFTHIDTERERCPNNLRIYTYHFKDSNGVTFTVVSRIVRYDTVLIRRITPESDYLLALTRANQEHITELLGQTGLTVQFMDDGKNGIDSVRFVVLVYNYDDLERAAEAVENTVNSLGHILLQDSQSGISFTLPAISVWHSNRASVARFPFWGVGGTQVQEIFQRLHDNYLDAIRHGRIDEELPYDIWWQSPRRNIFNIYFDRELIRGGQNRENDSMPYFRYNTELETYTIWLFNDQSILAWYVSKEGGSYNFDIDGLEATWTIGEDTWIAILYREITEHPRDPNKSSQLIRSEVIKIEQITKNGESLGVYRAHMTLPIFARMLGLTFEVDQMEAAVNLWSSDKNP